MDNEILELLKSMQISINELKEGQQETNKRLDRIEKKLDSVHEQTAHTMEDITEIKINTSKDIISLVNSYFRQLAFFCKFGNISLAKESDSCVR